MTVIQSDQVPEKDILNRQKFAKQIVRQVLQFTAGSADSIVLGISGEWGSGKTTLLQYIQEEIEDNEESKNNCQIVHFNSWQNSGAENVQRSLLEAVLKKIEKVSLKKNLKKANEKIKNYLKYLNYLKFLQHVHPVAQRIVSAVDDYQKKAEVNNVADLKKLVNEIIVTEKARLYIIIDDLDRLDPDEITLLFKTLKLSVDFKNTIFFVAYDKQVVIESLKTKFGANAESYLEKIIQVDFQIPVISDEQLERSFFSQIEFLRSRRQFSEDDKNRLMRLWKHHGLKQFFATMRDLKRFFNSLTICLPETELKIDIVEFIALEAIKVFDYKTYDSIFIRYKEFRRQMIWESLHFSQFAKSFNGISSPLISFLFTEPVGGYRARAAEEPVIREPEFFDRYFTLLQEEQRIDDLLNLYFIPGSNKESVLVGIWERGQMKNFLRQLSQENLAPYFAENPNWKWLLSDFLNFWDKRENLITAENIELLEACFYNFINCAPDKDTAAREGIEELEIRELEDRSLRFALLYFIIQRQKGKSDIQKIAYSDEVKGKILFYLPAHSERFFIHLEKNAQARLSKLGRGEGNYITDLFISTLAEYKPEAYEKEVAQWVDKGRFIYWVITHKFLEYDDAANDFKLDTSLKDRYIPQNIFQKFLNAVSSPPEGTFSKSEQSVIDRFEELFKLQDSW